LKINEIFFVVRNYFALLIRNMTLTRLVLLSKFRPMKLERMGDITKFRDSSPRCFPRLMFRYAAIRLLRDLYTVSARKERPTRFETDKNGCIENQPTFVCSYFLQICCNF